MNHSTSKRTPASWASTSAASRRRRPSRARVSPPGSRALLRHHDLAAADPARSWRRSPIVPGARSVIVTGNAVPDRPGKRSTSVNGRRDRESLRLGRRLSRGRRQASRRSLSWMRAQAGPAFDARVYVDTGPVQERVYALHAGLGWIGKNTCVINPALGSWLFLGVLITTLPLDPDAPGTDQCGTCQLCVSRVRLARSSSPWCSTPLCISYLTIEKRRIHRRRASPRYRDECLRVRHLSGRLSLQQPARRGPP